MKGVRRVKATDYGGEGAILLGTADGVMWGRGGSYEGEGSSSVSRAVPMTCRSEFQILTPGPRDLHILHKAALLQTELCLPKTRMWKS